MLATLDLGISKYGMAKSTLTGVISSYIISLQKTPLVTK